jgi:hypothetical protein
MDLVGKVTLEETTEAGPALASCEGRLFLAWKGAGNDNLNLTLSSDGSSFGGKHTFEDSSDRGPALAEHGGRLFMAWKGSGNENLNVARIQLWSDSQGGFGVEGIDQKVTLDDTTEQSPGLATAADRLLLAWKGAGNDQLNAIYSEDGGGSFVGKVTYDDASDMGPALAAGGAIGWKGSGNENLNLATCDFVGNSGGQFLGLDGVLANKVTLDDTTERGPAVAVMNRRVFLAWKGAGNDQLNIISTDMWGNDVRDKTTFEDASDQAPALAVHGGSLFLAWKGSGNENLNVARLTGGAAG